MDYEDLSDTNQLIFLDCLGRLLGNKDSIGHQMVMTYNMLI